MDKEEQVRIETVRLRNGEDIPVPLVALVTEQLREILEAGYKQNANKTYGPGGPGVIYELAHKAADPTHEFYPHAGVDKVIEKFGLEPWFEEDPKTERPKIKDGIAGIIQSAVAPDSGPLSVRLQDPTTSMGYHDFLKFPKPKSP